MMLEHVPAWIGALMRNIRAGHAKLAIVDPDLHIGHATIDLMSPAFANGARLPERFTADGEGVSPPLVWGQLPPGTASLALLVEDPDAPALNPVVHALVWGIPADAGRIPEGAIVPDGDGVADGEDVGLNSSFGEGWLPPDPPPGHGSHDYVFQLFALARRPDLAATPGRSELLEAISGHILASGLLVATYSRGEAFPTARAEGSQGIAAA
jgi:Raf kinase inhibitor-like YbhB/YbcL family protein